MALLWHSGEQAPHLAWVTQWNWSWMWGFRVSCLEGVSPGELALPLVCCDVARTRRDVLLPSLVPLLLWQMRELAWGHQNEGTGPVPYLAEKLKERRWALHLYCAAG